VDKELGVVRASSIGDVAEAVTGAVVESGLTWCARFGGLPRVLQGEHRREQERKKNPPALGKL
jgi:hypothetical protein